MAKERAANSVVIGPVMISFPQLDKPKAVGESDKLKYSAKFVIKKDDVATLEQIKKAMMAAAKAGQDIYKGKPIGGLGFRWPLRDAAKDAAEKGETLAPELKGCMFVNANSESPPGVVDKNKKPIIDIKNDVYAGCFVYASLNFFAYNNKGNRGVGCGLNNVLKFKEGERLSGRPSAEQDFADLDIEFEDSEEFDFDAGSEPDFTFD
jgi:hypothetical protein